jgi:3-methyladenine DNA glycosylase AlkD
LNREWARSTAESCIEAMNREDKEGFWKVLNPVLDVKVPFPLLDEIGKRLGEAGKLERQRYFQVFDEIVATYKMGGYVIVGQALAQFLETELEASIRKAAEVVVKGQEWYVCDIVGERVLGQALVDYFEPAILLLEQMVALEDQEVRRSIGVAVHFFAKRRPAEAERLRRLLSLLSLLIEDKRVFVVKGVGWGLKTIGKYQPKLVEEYLQEILGTKRVSKLMLRKATTYLDAKTKEKLWTVGGRAFRRQIKQLK